MTRAIILGLIGLVVGLTAATFVSLFRSLDEFGPAIELMDGEDDEAMAEGSAEAGESEELEGTDPVERLAQPEPGGTAPAAGEEGEGAPARTGTEAALATGGAGGGDGGAPDGSERLARIFGAMKPADAARVLEKLSDTEVRAVLRHVPDRKAAAILGNFDASRAASLSRSVIDQGSI